MFIFTEFQCAKLQYNLPFQARVNPMSLSLKNSDDGVV